MLVNTLATGAGNAWAVVVTLASIPLLLDGLGADAFGLWALLQTLSAITGWLSLADLGVGTASVKLVAQAQARGHRDEAGRIIGAAVVTTVVAGTVSGILVATVGRALLLGLVDVPESLVEPFGLAITIFGAQILFDLCTGALTSCCEGLQRIDRSRSVDAVRRTASAVAAVVAARVWGTLPAVGLATLLVAVASTALAAAVLARVAVGIRPHPTLGTLRSLLRTGWGALSLRSLGTIHRTMDRLIVGIMIGPSSVALIEIAAQIQAGGDAVVSATSYATQPSAAHLAAQDEPGKLRDLLEQATRYVVLVTWGVVVVVGMLAAPIVRLWVGDEFSEAGAVASLGLLYVATLAVVQVGSNVLFALGRVGLLFRAMAVATAVNLVTSVALVEAFGVAGAAAGTVMSGIISAPILIRGLHRHAGVPGGELLRRSVGPAVGPTAAAALVLAAVVAAPLGDLFTVLVGAALGGGAYALVTVSRVLRPGELRDLSGALSARHRASAEVSAPDQP